MSEMPDTAAVATAIPDVPSDPGALVDGGLGVVVSVTESLIPQPVRDLLDAGGPVMLVLAALSIVALAIVLAKLWQLAELRDGGAERIEPALADWRGGRHRAAVERLDAASNPLAGIVRAAMIGCVHQNDPGVLREEIERQAGGLLATLRGHLRGLELIASLSPLLGLLGTVIGMIDAFRALEIAGNQVDPSVLSGGIWVALLTTAAGLAVAIPAVVALNWLERLVEGATRRLEDQVTRVFTADLRLADPSAPVASMPLEVRAADAP